MKLGGDTVYRGKLKAKPYFGDGDGRITQANVFAALSLGSMIDTLILVALGFGTALLGANA